jgi:hypothetical protein
VSQLGLQQRTYYWAQADRMRQRAAGIEDPEIRQVYMSLAAQWERLAHQSALTPPETGNNQDDSGPTTN